MRWTPWGAAESIRALGAGIECVSTAGHGGIYLAPERWTEFQAMFPLFRPWAGAMWLEEDQDVTLAILAWPEFFKPESRFFAVEEARRAADYFSIPAEWWTGEHGKRLAEEADAFKQAVASQWKVGGMSSTGGEGWDVNLYRVSDDQRRCVRMPDYPCKTFYSDEDLAGFSEAPQE